MPQIIELTHRMEFWTQQVSTRTKPWIADLCYWMFSIRDNKSVNTWRQLKANRASNCGTHASMAGQRVQSSILDGVAHVSGRETGPQRQEGGTLVNNSCWSPLSNDGAPGMFLLAFYLSTSSPRYDVSLLLRVATCLRKSWEVLNLNRAVADGGFQ